jgi:hypothetical protein
VQNRYIEPSRKATQQQTPVKKFQPKKSEADAEKPAAKTDAAAPKPKIGKDEIAKRLAKVATGEDRAKETAVDSEEAPRRKRKRTRTRRRKKTESAENTGGQKETSKAAAKDEPEPVEDETVIRLR